MSDAPSEPVSPFADPQSFVALPRLAGLALSPDGSRLVTTVAGLDRDRTAWRPALWEVDPTGKVPARRLTRGPKGESSPVFTPEGDLLFVSARVDPDVAPDAPETAALWSLPAGGGEAHVVRTRPGGISAPRVAREAGTVLATSATLPGAVTGDDDAARRKARSERRIAAILHDGYPVRFWDHDLGPDEARLLAARPGEPWTDLTPAPGRALVDTTADIAPDGRTAVTGWNVSEGYGASRAVVVAFDTTTGERRTLLDDPDHDYGTPRVSPDGRTVAAIRTRRSTPERAPRMTLVLVPLAGGASRGLAADWDRWPGDLTWTPDAAALVVTADEQGRGPLFRVEVGTGAVTRLTGDHGAYTDPVVSPDGASVYALRSAVDSPPAPVRLDAHTPDQEPTPLPGPAEAPAMPGTLTEVTATAEDGSPLRAWLVLPDVDEPAPLLLWVHGGPLNSWNAWQWRWNPWLMAARGYAVLLPDPALSTGYGQDFVQRGWGAWGGPPFTDLMAVTDAAEALPEIDASRTAAMGGSFGGYMANWIAGHTDRFRAIVTHASLWALDQFGPTTDLADYWLTEMTPAMAAANSPHHHVDAITTPMLVIHGDKDYRVPVGEGLRLWWDLQSRVADPAANPHRFLYFPDENHWVLTPQHAALWYETVYAFLAHHVLGEPWRTPDLLR
ncbi:S9 family peptidase [Pseudonocardia kujensis]|uniref:S9 family peptidase n=1 Tax=Pseudonocardia kujensis TaxID=1128675 RepID=UPI001E397697|nr:S9 family peptidase [Pseudonocardia kujensis]MCE0762986.1 S9 family peptidase [Pseudonocardia kujensis]